MINKIVIFASGGGTNFIAIYKNILKSKIENSKISLLVSNNPNSGAVEFARKNNIEIFIANRKIYPNDEKYKKTLIDKLTNVSPDLIVLAGYMKLIPGEVTSLFENRIINIHPGKLPEFGGEGMYGLNVHKAVIESREKYTAVSIHHVNERYDEGKIIYEEKIRVFRDDTPESLSDRVLNYEHKIYSVVINNLLNERYN